MLKEIMLAGLGFVTLTKERAEEIVQELIKKGEISSEEGKDYLNLLLKKAEQQKDRFMAQVTEKTKETLKAMNVITREEYDKLVKRVNQLEKRLEEIQKTLGN